MLIENDEKILYYDHQSTKENNEGRQFMSELSNNIVTDSYAAANTLCPSCTTENRKANEKKGVLKLTQTNVMTKSPKG